MFFMLGTWPGKKDLGTFEGYNVYMTFTSIVIFFIPLFKCGKQYFAEKNGRTYQLDPEVGRQLERGEEVPLRFTGEVQNTWNQTGGMWNTTNSEWARNYSNPATDEASSANAAYTADPTAGAAIYGSNNPIGSAASGESANTGRMKICMRCKYRTDNEEFTHCPMCGNKLVHE